jgi:hypothetical protein
LLLLIRLESPMEAPELSYKTHLTFYKLMARSLPYVILYPQNANNFHDNKLKIRQDNLKSDRKQKKDISIKPDII